MKNLYHVGVGLLVLVFTGVSIFVAYTVTTRTLTGLESFFWQIFVFGVGLVGSFIFGRQSAREAAREIIKPHARSAFRRLLSISKSFSGIGRDKTITKLRGSRGFPSDARQA